MNGNDTKPKNKEVIKEFEVSDESIGKVKIKMTEQSLDVLGDDKRKTKDNLTLKAKVIRGEKGKKIEGDIEKADEKDIIVKYKGDGTWWPHLEIQKIDGLEVKAPEKAKVAVKGLWTTTAHLCIWGGLVVVAVLVGVLVWSLFKKDSEDTED